MCDGGDAVCVVVCVLCGDVLCVGLCAGSAEGVVGVGVSREGLLCGVVCDV